LIRVKKGKGTRFDGKLYVEGRDYTLPKDVEERWIARGIAERITAPTILAKAEAAEHTGAAMIHPADVTLTPEPIAEPEPITKSGRRRKKDGRV